MVKNWGILKVDEVLSLIPKEFIPNLRRKIPIKNRSGQTFVVNVTSLRLITFKTKGTSCCYCGIKATHFQLDELYGKKKKPIGKPHLNLYSDDIVMTKEHILPKSSGGKDVLDNLDTCCQQCNELRGNLILPSIN